MGGFPPKGSRDSLRCFMLRNKKRIMLDSVSNVAQRQTILYFMFVFLSVCFLTMWLLLRELFPSPRLINWSSMWPMGYALFYLNRDVAAGMEYLESKNLVHRYEMPLLAPNFNIKGICLSFAFIIFETVPKKNLFSWDVQLFVTLMMLRLQVAKNQCFSSFDSNIYIPV